MSGGKNCLECGKGPFESLGLHISHQHAGLGVRGYRIKYGIPASEPLTSDRLHGDYQQRALNLGEEWRLAGVEAAKGKPPADIVEAREMQRLGGEKRAEREVGAAIALVHQNDMITVRELATSAGISTSTVHSAIQDGRLPAQVFEVNGRRVYGVRWTDYEAAVQAGRMEKMVDEG